MTDHDRSYIESGNIVIARILVHLDTREGLVESLRLQYRELIRWQILDYEGAPIWCRCYHEVGHLYKDCPLITSVHIKSPKRQTTTGTQTHLDIRSTPAQNASTEPPRQQRETGKTPLQPDALPPSARVTRFHSSGTDLILVTLISSPPISCHVFNSVYANLSLVASGSGLSVYNLSPITCPVATAPPTS